MTRSDSRPTFVCPACRALLQSSPDQYRCTGCDHAYPLVAGIPDFRLQPDPWIGIHEDREKALRLADAVDDLPFLDAVRLYWEMTPDTPRQRVHHFVRHVERSLARSAEWLDSGALPEDGGVWLDLGAGTGDLSAAVRRRGRCAVAVDIALRWLVIARRRPELEQAMLVCGAAQHLPFPDSSFAGGFSLGLLEHCPAPEPVLGEARRVLAPGAMLRLRTVNRYGLLREPHVGLWGVGLLPRRWADPYVRFRTGQRYLHHRPISPRELRRALHRAGFTSVQVAAARALPSETAQLGKVAAVLGGLYDAGRQVPGLRGGLGWVAPVLEAEATA